VEPMASGNVAVQLSIIIPAFNAERYLEDCVESILGQSFTEFELLLVDDGSTDGTAEVAEDFSLRDPRIGVFHLENGGPSSARNFGLKQARGVYVQFVDADDVLEPDCLQTMYEAVKCGDPDLVVVGARIVDAHMAEMARIDVPRNGAYSVEELLSSLTPATKATLLHYVWNKWYRLSLIRERGIDFDPDVRLGEDFLFNCDYWAVCSRLCLVDQRLYSYIKRDAASLTGRFAPDELARRRRMDGALVDLYDGLGLLDEHRDTLGELMGAIAMESMSRIALPDCRLTPREKREYVDAFVRSEYRDLMVAYAQGGEAGTLHVIEGMLLRREATNLLYSLINLHAIARRIMRRLSVRILPGVTSTT